MKDKIFNQKKEVPKSNELNDLDYMDTILGIEKALVKNYAVALTEASNNMLYDEYNDMFIDVCNNQRNIYDLMFKYGWYTLTEAKEKDISEKQGNFTTQISEL